MASSGHAAEPDTASDGLEGRLDPVVTNPDHYAVVLETNGARVLRYIDAPGDRTTPHDHPDSIMITLGPFRRRLYAADGASRDVEMPAGHVAWLPAQRHSGHNIGDTETRVIFVELPGLAADGASATLGPAEPTTGAAD